MNKTYPFLLFHPNIPKPLHGLAPRTIKGNKWWTETKASSKAKLNDHCWSCGVHKTQAKYRKWLEAHENYSVNYSSGRVEYVGTCALCHACHNFIHDGRLINLINKDEYSFHQFEEIMNHGNAILKAFIESIGHEWIGGKQWHFVEGEHGSVLEKSNQLLDSYPFIGTYSQKVQWVGNGCEWGDYHLVIDGDRHERKFATKQDWVDFYA